MKTLNKSARQRLTELGMTKNQIDAIEQNGRRRQSLSFAGTDSGTVVKKV